MCGPDEGKISDILPRQGFCVRCVIFDFSLEHRFDAIGASIVRTRGANANVDRRRAVAKGCRQDIRRSKSRVRDKMRGLEFGRRVAHRRYVVNCLGYAAVALRNFAFRAAECVRAIRAKSAFATTFTRDGVRRARYAKPDSCRFQVVCGV